MEKYSYDTAKNNALTHKIVSQYTTFEALEKIISNQALRLTRVDLLNDISENEKIGALWKYKIYVSCFTHRENESYFFWKTYTNKKADTETNGVMLSFQTAHLYNLPIYPDEQCLTKPLSISKAIEDINFCADVSNESWGIFDYSFLDVTYIPRNIFLQEITHHQGRIKYLEWNSEEETRIRVAIRPHCFDAKLDGLKIGYHTPDNQYLYAKLPFACLESMIITLSPFAHPLLEEKVNALLKNYNLYGKVQVITSVLTGEAH